ncbi:hypothetical protein AVEN_184524-1 [Araneus ventricosus]|uniref:Uncharacterized protein n=1 Tax=Araneus ventricosus TaxID=182803 RepID=A0A4Y2X1A6_ARAVE|nr:hypothetical protein AVEN_197405-1 [Araneus ventricosus]GBO42561.1 hypothetical protein AVEN_184524-1 [Araneus ventricosus]
MGSRFPAMLVLWLEREFYKVKHGVTAAAVPGSLTLASNLATILVTWRQILLPWRQIDDSRKYNPFLDISIRQGYEERVRLEYTRKLHVTSRSVGESI